MKYNEHLLTHGHSVLPAGLIGMLDYVFTGEVPFFYGNSENYAALESITYYLFEKTFNERMCCLRTGRRKDRTREAVDILIATERPSFVKEVIIPTIEKMLPPKCHAVYSPRLKRLRIERIE